MKFGSIRLLPQFFLFLAILLMIIPVRWLLCWLTAAGLHEIFHLIALKICGYPIRSVSVGAFGVKIDTDTDRGIKGVFCALAGPLAGFILLLFVRRIPMIALCGLFQSVANLVPVYPLDGGRALNNLLYLIFPDHRADLITRYIERGIWFILFVICVYGVVKLNLGVIPVSAIMMLYIRKKYLANTGVKRYNMSNRI